MKGVFGAMVVLVCAAVSSSCGGGSSSCGGVSPCGGDPVGTWKFGAQCTTDTSSFANEFCPTATASVAGLRASGSVTFGADMSYTVDLTQSGTIQMTIPPTCLMQGGITLTCSQLQQSVQAALAGDPDAPFTSVTCSGVGACSCSFALSSTTKESGTWAVQGTTLALSGGGMDSGDFCVKGSELHLITVDTTMTMGSMGQAKITSDIVAFKQ